MNQIKFNIPFIVLLAFGFQSCDQNIGEHPDNAVTIEISSPVKNSEYAFGDMINIEATVSAESELHGYKIEINNLSGEALFEKEIHEHDDHFDINEDWMDDVEDGGILIVTVTVAVDHEGNTESESVKIIGQPK